jgi:co-chaperonin GroES (HSP10)
VLVRIEPEPEMMGSIYVPQECRADSKWGTVAAVGPQVNDLKAGDKVYFVPQRSFHEIILNGVRHKLFEETALEGVMA